ncbi:MAG: hypothetical protein DWP94_12545 [Flavobacterium sp.]|nr:MAG: hypothetical protein DWP94_12545 [Flavobacterium sp.]
METPKNSFHFKLSQNKLLSCCLILLMGMALVSCGSFTKVKYIQHQASTKLKLADNTVLTAPSGSHYMLYLVNCIDNSKRNEGFFFTANRLRNESGQDVRVVDVPLITKLVATGGTETDIGQVVFEVSGPPEAVFCNLNYASFGSEKVLMVNQTTSGPIYGPSIGFVDMIELSSSSSQYSPFIKENYCADKGTYHN